MAVRLHPDSELLVDYASGSLSPALCVSISAHLHFCEKCRLTQDDLIEIGGSLLANGTPAQMTASAFDSVMNEIDSQSLSEDKNALQSKTVVSNLTTKLELSEDTQKLPKIIQNLIPLPEWNFLSPSLRVAKIAVGEEKYELALHKIKAGGKTPMHDHKGMEVTMVLYGSFSDADGIYNEGDFIVRSPGDIHSPLATPDDECICLSVVEAPIRLVGPLMRVMNPFLSFNPV